MSLKGPVKAWLLALAGLLIAAAPPAPAADGTAGSGGTKAAGAGVPVDEREAWRIGFCALEPIDLDPASLYLVHSIPLVVRQKLSGAKEHRLSDAEKAARRTELVEGRIRDTSAKLIAARRARDEIAEASEPQAGALEKKKAEIDLLVGQIRDLETLGRAAIAVADAKPVEIVSAPAGSSGSEGSSDLLASPRYSPLEAARAANVDLLVFGSIEQIDEYLFLTVKAIRYPGGELALEYQDVFGTTSVFPSLDALAGELAGTVLGRPWGSLRIRASPGDARIYVGGEFAGTGEATVRFAEVGEAELAVSCLGFRPAVRTVAVEAGEEATVEIALEAMEAARAVLSSSPLLSDVYVDSRWVGRTPVEVVLPEGTERVEVSREGYEGRSFHITPAGPLAKTTILPPLSFDPDERQKSARESFYRSLGVWVVTLPVPLCLYAICNDQASTYLGAAAGAGTANLAELYVRYRRLYAGYVGGLFVNLSLLANMVIDLVRYVQAADRPAG